MIAQDATGKIVGYGNVGLLAVGATLVTLWLVGRIRLHAVTTNTA